MKVTIEIGSDNEMAQLLHFLKEMKVEDISLVATKRADKLLQQLAKPIKKKLDLDELIKERNYKGVDREKFDKLVKKLDIKEPIELLLSQL